MKTALETLQRITAQLDILRASDLESPQPDAIAAVQSILAELDVLRAQMNE